MLSAAHHRMSKARHAETPSWVLVPEEVVVGDTCGGARSYR
jgi:hypothetical protein